MFITLNPTCDGDVPILSCFGGQGKEMKREFFQRLTLLVIGLFVNIYVVEIPLSERLEHALVLGALNELGDRQSLDGNFSVMTFGDKDDLSAVTGHARRERLKPAWTGR